MKKIMMLLICGAFASAAMASKNDAPVRLEITDSPRIAYEDSVVVKIPVRITKEIFKKQMEHRIIVFVLEANDSGQQQFVSAIAMRGKARSRALARQRRKEGLETPRYQWNRNFKKREVEQGPVIFEIKGPIMEWMDDNVVVYIQQTQSPKIKGETTEFDYEIYFPEFE